MFNAIGETGWPVFGFHIDDFEKNVRVSPIPAGTHPVRISIAVDDRRRLEEAAGVKAAGPILEMMLTPKAARQLRDQIDTLISGMYGPEPHSDT